MKKLLFIISTVFIIQICKAQTSSDYFGQTPPGDTAVIFAPGIISIPNRFESNMVFYPDSNEIYFDSWVTTDTVYKILYTKRVNNTWTEQLALPFNGNQNAGSPFLSADGNKLYFEKESDIWTVERTSGGWGEPRRLPSPVNTTSDDYYYSGTANGIGYITSNRSGGKGNLDIWQIRSLPNDSFQVENLGPIVNSSTADFTSVIAHDGSYIIFASYRYSGYSLQDLWISFYKGKSEWSVPVSMERSGAKINVTHYYEHSPSLSPDGKYLFFSRENETNDQRDVYWVSTHIIVGLKKYAFAPKLNRQIPNLSISTDSVINYIIPNNTFSCEYGTDSLKYTATLNNGSALPSWLHFDSDTRTLWGTPTQAETDTIKIMATNIDTVSASCTFRITVTNLTGIEEDKNSLPNEFKLSQNYPNPFNPSTIISYQLSVSRNVILKIYDALGREVKTLVNSFQGAGEHSITWDAKDDKNNPVSSGIYFYRLETDFNTLQNKMVLLR